MVLRKVNRAQSMISFIRWGRTTAIDPINTASAPTRSRSEISSTVRIPFPPTIGMWTPESRSSWIFSRVKGRHAGLESPPSPSIPRRRIGDTEPNRDQSILPMVDGSRKGIVLPIQRASAIRETSSRTEVGMRALVFATTGIPRSDFAISRSLQISE